MPAYLLDSNALSDLIRNPGGTVSQRFERKAADPSNELLTSIVTACETRYGAVKKGSRMLSERMDRTLDAVRVVPLSIGADAAYAVLRTDLERKGQLIGPNDMLIAAHALALDAILVTDNVREFKRVKGLRIENWLRP
jgi:tRNA(fMet)-specific endonuclease VapC